MFIYTHSHSNKIINSEYVEYFHIVHDEETNTYNVLAVLASGVYTTVGEYKTEEEATEVLYKLYFSLGDENIRAFDMN